MTTEGAGGAYLDFIQLFEARFEPVKELYKVKFNTLGFSQIMLLEAAVLPGAYGGGGCLWG